ncbi:GNAT family N-acetyltransferase [Roseibium salinum]|uniref:GNAT family N-acetyltransferase n=1 Tax=Roseibium salinum TaxID=1604349 RepID=A0ABT3R1T8_9HYPH|nr:GNAT family N-acetyltransferase [Roseibium sp. DSM 29163]MCX2723115.1 GNAT family N-acetyltransferase [Roseibium sp. DSM 29163]
MTSPPTKDSHNPAMPGDGDTVSLRLLSSLKDVQADAWDQVANPGWRLSGRGLLQRDECSAGLSDLTLALGGDAGPAPEETPFNPFLSHAFLEALERAGCATSSTGWLPRHMLLEDRAGTVLGAVPAYLKSHSQGEYVFDHGWADAFYRAGGEYYPKLQISVPFTPATGRRFLTGPGVNREAGLQALAAGLVQVCQRTGASSVHATFLTKAEWDTLGELGYLRRTDQQFHWENSGYDSFDGFLANLASRKRKAIKKERREALSAEGIEVEWVTGSDLTEAHWDTFFTFYMDTGSRKWGRPYLNRKFFSLINERLADRTLLVLAKRNGRYIAGALNFIGSETLFGRHWGCTEHHPFLHFELCYYQAIDFAIARGLKRVEAGAQGAHKLARGYLPTTTYSAHWIAHEGLHDAVADFLEHERIAVERENEALAEHAPFKKGG